jgi:hypothetical protein
MPWSRSSWLKWVWGDAVLAFLAGEVFDVFGQNRVADLLTEGPHTGDEVALAFGEIQLHAIHHAGLVWVVGVPVAGDAGVQPEVDVFPWDDPVWIADSVVHRAASLLSVHGRAGSAVRRRTRSYCRGSSMLLSIR